MGGFLRIAGLDEAGCGPLAGPVVAACVILPPCLHLANLRDSKKLSPKQRTALYHTLCSQAEFATGIVEAAEIDLLGIRPATYLAMERAVAALAVPPDYLLVDYWTLPFWQHGQAGITKGDATVRSIAAASIIAKVTRDQLMLAADAIYPAYGFARHKGYPTKEHYHCIDEHGLSPLHRRSFLKDKAR